MRPLALPDPPLSDDDIALRPWRQVDAPALTELCQDEAIVRWTSVPADYTLDMARTRVARAEAERLAGRALILAVVGSSSDVLGACDLLVIADDPKRAEVAFMLGAHARGRGVMTRAVRLISRWGIEQLGIERLEVLAHPENGASIAVAKRAGFTEEGLLRGYRVKKARREDRIVLSLLAADLKPHSDE